MTIVRTGRRNGHTLYLQVGDDPEDNDVFLGSCSTPALARLVAVAATCGLAHHPQMIRDEEDMISAITDAMRATGPGRTGCPTSECVHPSSRHVVTVEHGDRGRHRCVDCPGGDGTIGP